LQARQGLGSRPLAKQLISLVVAGTGTVTGTCPIIPGSWLSTVQIETNAAISGTPTTCNVRIGTTAAGQDVVADVDCKGAADLTATVVAALDRINGLANINTLFAQVVTTGGTAPAGPINITIAYNPPLV
jgi:hypothetical protein